MAEETWSVLLHCYYRVPIGRRVMKRMSHTLGDLVKVPRVGQTGDFSVTLSVEVKQAILSSLINNGLALSPGVATLQRNELLSQLSFACQLETIADVALVWHIATSACGFSAPQYKDDHFTVATQLSNYCAYLVNFAPELLPDHPYCTESVFSKAVEEALVIFKGLNLEQRCKWIMTMNEEDTSSSFRKGAVLARKLLDDVMGDPSKGWRVLAEFWAELLLCLAPSNNETAHGEHLAQGGEFITHLTLLTHAGVGTRDSFATT